MGVTYEYALEHILERRLTAQTGYGCQAVPEGSDERERVIRGRERQRE
jgi:hypothetical protein